MKFIKRFAILTTLGIFTSIAAGCGGSSQSEVPEQQSTANQQAARTAAYGDAGNPAKANKRGKSTMSPAAQAKRGDR